MYGYLVTAFGNDEKFVDFEKEATMENVLIRLWLYKQRGYDVEIFDCRTRQYIFC